jgi:Zn-dependent protease with chaperone function
MDFPPHAHDCMSGSYDAGRSRITPAEGEITGCPGLDSIELRRANWQDPRRYRTGATRQPGPGSRHGSAPALGGGCFRGERSISMDYGAIRIALEKTLSEELYEKFRGDIIQRILREGKVESSKNYLRSILEGHSFKITERMAPKLHAVCREVQQMLEFEEPVEYFITSSRDINCAAYPRLEDDQSHLVMINSGALERFTDDELRFVIGHEMGHLISQNAELVRIISFVFPQGDQIPLIFKNKLELWNKLSELSADRYGYIAVPQLEISVGAFFKMASGLDAGRIAFDPIAYLEEMDKVLDYFRTESAAVRSTHPINPVRLKALQFFSESNLFRAVASD